MTLLLPWLSAFLFTQAVEAPLYAWLLRKRQVRLFALYALLPTAVTHPVVWFVMPELVDDWHLMVLAAETFAVLVEAAILYRPLGKRALLWSLLANGLSLGLGLSSRALFGWP